MEVLRTIAGIQTWVAQGRGRVALVPTMGALHEGHGSLIRRAVQECDRVVVSIFVNPLQFGPREDFHKYPRTWDADRQYCESLGVGAIFAPGAEELYPQGAGTTQVIAPASMTENLCSAFRPTHFAGVTTVVAKLLQIVRPTVAYFGEKDAQQLALIRQMVADLHLPVDIAPCPIVRDSLGLALSSRNQYLSPENRQRAGVIYRGLQAGRLLFLQGERQSDRLIAQVKATLVQEAAMTVQYVELVDPDSLRPLTVVEHEGLLAIAAFVGRTRLIDNLRLRDRRPIIAIDGPAGAGKSTVTKRVAAQLNLRFLDTGAMYRAIAWLVLQQQCDPGDVVAVAELAAQARLEFAADADPAAPLGVRVNGQEVTQAIRRPEVTRLVSAIAAQKAVREILLPQQRQLGRAGGLVAEGRDIGTHVFPDAEVKIFLTATPEERARRRLAELVAQGHRDMTLEQLVQEIAARDAQDSERDIAPLRQAADAQLIVTDGLSLDQVTGEICDRYHEVASLMT